MFYYGDFSSKEDVLRDFQISEIGGHIVFAQYECDSYDGSADVVFLKDRKVFYVHGGHCSCYGLEDDQWSPEEMTFEQMEHIAKNGYGFWKQNARLIVGLREVIKRRLKPGSKTFNAVLEKAVLNS